MNRIREKRKALGLTLKQLGAVIGVSEGGMSHYETGRREPDPDTLKRIATALGVSVDYLLGNDDDSKSVQSVPDPAPVSEGEQIRQQILRELQELPDSAFENALQYIRFLKSNTKDGPPK